MFFLDHVVHYTADPSEAVDVMKKQNLYAIEGGEHPNWGTRNSLCYFDLNYVEFLGIENPVLAEKVTDNVLVQRVVKQARIGAGLSQIALRTHDMASTVANLRGKGLKVPDPIPGKRTRSDGKTLEWQLLFPQKDDYDGPPLPFIIQWNENDQARRRDLKDQKAIGNHPAGDLNLSYVGFAVKNLRQRVEEWSGWFDLEVGETFTDEKLNARCQVLELSGSKLLFCEPIGPGRAQETLDSRGEQPFLVAISGTTEKKDIDLMGALYRFLT